MPLYINRIEIPLDIESQGGAAIDAYLQSFAPVAPTPADVSEPTPEAATPIESDTAVSGENGE